MKHQAYQEHLNRHSDVREHLGLLCGLALQCKVVVEFGFRTGISASAFLAGGAQLYSFDTDIRCKPHVRRLANDYPHTFVFKVGDSRDVDIPRCQMLFIDSDHTFDTTMQELIRHDSMVDKWIVLHDTESFGRRDRLPGKGKGVYSAIETFLSMGTLPTWRLFLHLRNNNGLTILERRNE